MDWLQGIPVLQQLAMVILTFSLVRDWLQGILQQLTMVILTFSLGRVWSWTGSREYRYSSSWPWLFLPSPWSGTGSREYSSS